MKVLIASILVSVFLAFVQDKYGLQREQMVKDQLILRGINNKLVLDAMRKVPRELFVPTSMQERAYEDNALPIDKNQTISQPYIVAFMTEMIDPAPTDKVLEIGTGSGYQAAVLAEIVEKVYTIEIIPELGQQAKLTLDAIGYENIETKIGDGYHGWKDHAPYDAIIVTAAPENIPQPLIDQLKDGGKMIIPVGPVYSTQFLILVAKHKGEATTKRTIPVRFVPFTRD